MLYKKINKKLKQVINQLESENDILKYNNTILIDDNRKLRGKIYDLEKNLEFVTNNLSAQKRKKLGL